MTRTTPGTVQPRSGKNKNGFVLIIVVIIIAAVLGIILLSTTLTTITSLTESSVRLNGVRASRHAESCLQEGLLQLHRDISFASATIPFQGGTCAITTSGSGNTRAITAIGSLNGMTQTLTVTTTLNPFDIVSWDAD